MEVELAAHVSPISVQTLGPMRVACYQVISPAPEDEAFAFMRQWIARQPDAGLDHLRLFGFDVEVPPERAQSGCRGYEAWATVSNATLSSEGVTVRDFPGGLYAVARLYDPFSDPFWIIPAGWQYLVDWASGNPGYQLGQHQPLEEVLETPEGTCLDLYLPLIAR